MSHRFVIVALIAIAVLAVPAAFLIGRHQGPSATDIGSEPEPATTPVPQQAEPPPAGGAPDTVGLGDLVAATSDRLAAQARDTVQEAATSLTRELEDRLRDTAEEAERATRTLGDELDQRLDALQRATAEQGDLLAEQSQAIAVAGRAAAENLATTADELRAQVAESLGVIDHEAEAARARLLALAKSAGATAAGGSTRIAQDVHTGLQRAIDELQAARGDFRQQADAAHQRFTDAVAKAQQDAEQQRHKALALVETAGTAFQAQVAAAKKELTAALRRAQTAASADVARIVGKADAARRGGK